MTESTSSGSSERIAIFGAYKSGTTALFYKIKNSIPRATRTLFEPKRYIRADDDAASGVLAKVIVAPDAGVDMGSFQEFERKVLLVRDPRDWIVSAALFLPQELEQIYRNKDRLDKVLGLLASKERDPRSQTFHAILTEILALGGDASSDLPGRIKRHIAHFSAIADWLNGSHLQKYEGMIDGDWSGLEAYLGFPLAGEAKVDDVHAHVPRTLSYGDWKNWFLESDVKYFRELFLPYMLKFGYGDDWNLPERGAIQPEFCTGYVKRVVELRKSKKPISFSYRLCRQEDGDEINRGFNEIFGQKRSHENWRWKFLESKMPLKAVAGVNSFGSIISHFGVIHERVQVDGRNYMAGQAVDSYCLRRPGTLAHRVFIKTVTTFYEHFRKPEHFGLFVGFPGRRHLRLGQLKLEYGESKPFAIWRRERPVQLGWRARWGTAFARKPEVLYEEPSETWCDSLWQSARSRYPVAVVRDYEWIRCRYLSRPGKPYKFVCVQRNGVPSAWAVFRASSGAMQWVDALWDGRSVADLIALDREADRVAGEADQASIELWLSGDAAVESYLRSSGWAEGRHAEDLGLSVLLIDEELSGRNVLDRFYITLGDTDLA